VLPLTDHTPPICNYEGSDYQENFWDRADRTYEDATEAVALRRLVPNSGDRMLEIGAGAGRHTHRFGGYKQVVLLDYSETQLRQAMERLGTGRRLVYVAADAYRLPFEPGAFDGVTMIRTLHHMADPNAVIAQVRKVLAGEATFVLEFANKRNLKAILRWMARRQDWNPFTPESVEFAELNFDFHPSRVRQWLDQSGFKISRQLTVSHFRLPVLKHVVPNRLLVAMDAMLQWTGALWQLTPSVFVRSHANGPALQEQIPWCCPNCGAGKLHAEREAMRCTSCDREWPIKAGIYDFRLGK
jgi:ubiquinone/menaquinone biosynthesis C-methylase UbiE